MISCAIAFVLLLSSILMHFFVDKKDDFMLTLNEDQKQMYKSIILERFKIYIFGMIFGLLLALTYVYNDTSDCSTDVAYKKQLKALKLNFTPDTLVIRIYYEIPIFKPGILEFKNHKTLDQMPGYNDV